MAALTRLLLGPEKRSRGGEAAKISDKTARALWLCIYNHGDYTLYQMLADIFAGPQRKGVSTWHHEEFVAIGHAEGYAALSAAYYRHLGYLPESGLWQVSCDAAKMTGKFEVNQSTKEITGSVHFDQHFFMRSYADWARVRDEETPAEYILPFVLTPLHARLPSALRVQALIPTNLGYTANDVESNLQKVVANLRADGFKNIVAFAADNAPVHRKAMLARALSGGDAVVLNGGAVQRGARRLLSEVLTLGESADGVISFLDTAHNAKNASLQQMSMARVLMLGRWPVLAAHLVDVQASDPSAGLYACDTAGSGPGWSPP